MTISWRTATGLVAGTSRSLTWTLPTGHTVGDLLVAIYGGKPFSSTSGTPTDYTGRGSVASSSNANANGAGSTRAMVFTKTHDGTESNPTATLTATPSPSMVAMLAASKTEPGTWLIANTTGADATLTGTEISATGADSLTVRAGERVVVVSVGNDNLETESGAALAIGDATFTITEVLATNATSTGNDGSMAVYDCLVTAGGTGAPVFTATSGRSGNSERAVIFLQLWEPVNRTQTDDIGTTDTLVIAFTKTFGDPIGIASQASRVIAVDRDPVDITDSLYVEPGWYQSETGLGVTDSYSSTRTISLLHGVDLSDVDEPHTALTGGATLIENDEDITDSVAPLKVADAGVEAVGVTDSLHVVVGLYQSETGVGVTDSAIAGGSLLIEDWVGVEDEWPDNPDPYSGSGFNRSSAIDWETVGLRDSLHVVPGLYQTEGAIGIADDEIVPYNSGPQALTRNVGPDSTGLTDVGFYFEVDDELDTDSVGLTDSVSAHKGVYETDAVDITDSYLRGREVRLSDDATTAVDIVITTEPSGVTYAISVPTDSVGVTDAGQPDASHYVPSAISRSVEDQVGLTHQPIGLDWTGYAARGVEDESDITDAVTVAHVVALVDGIGVTDPMAITKRIALVDDEDVTDTASTLRRGHTDNVGISDGTPDVRHERRGYIFVPVPNNVRLTDEISVIMRRVVTVEDMLDVIDIATLRSPSLRLGVSDVIGTTEPTGYPDVFGWRPVWSLKTPTVKEAPIGGHRLFHFYKNDHGVSLLIHGTTVTEKRWPTVDELEAADRYYIGGHVCRVDSVEAEFLTEAGYGDYLTLTQERIITYA